MLKLKIILSILLLSIWGLATGCANLDNGGSFDGGHEWIMPNPPAEFNLLITDIDGNPIRNAIVTVYLGDTKLEQNKDFVDYDGAVGYPADENGTISIVYLGDQGGGYEVPLGSSGPAELYLAVEAKGYELQKAGVIDYLFSNDHILGDKSFEFDDITFELKIIEDTITLNR